MKREKYIDVAKGFGMLLVVLCHTIIHCDLKSHEGLYFIINVIYSFHMPLFFFISGYCLGIKKETGEKPPVLRQIQRIARNLLLPYLVWSVIYMLISDKLFDTGKLNALLTGSGIAPMWFLATLAFCEIAFLFIRRLTYKMKFAPRLLTILGLAVMFFVIAYILWRIKAIHSLSAKTMGITNFYLFNAFARFTLSLPILIIGYIISQLNIIKAMGKIWCALTGTAMLAGVCLIVHFTSLGTNFHMFFSNNLLLLMCTALLGSCGVLMLSYAVGEYSKVLNFMGINSLFILMLHYPPFKTIAYANNIVRCFTRNPIIIAIAATTLTLLISIAGMWLIKNKFFLTKSTGKAKDIK